MSVISSLQAILTDISDALRNMNNTSKKYTISEIADGIRNGCQVYYLGQGTSFNVSSVAGYQNFTVNNFIVCTGSFYAKAYGYIYDGSSNQNKVEHEHTITQTPTYDASTGILTVSNPTVSVQKGNGNEQCGLKMSITAPKVYLVIGSCKSI